MGLLLLVKKNRSDVPPNNPVKKDLTVNANLLAAEVLSYCDYISEENKYQEYIERVIQFIFNTQNEGGSWYYSFDYNSRIPKKQIDFHHGYVLKSYVLKGAKFKIVARDRKHVFTLLRSIQLNYVNRGRGFSGAFGKLLYLPYGVYLVYKKAVKFKADFFLGFADGSIATINYFSNGKNNLPKEYIEVFSGDQVAVINYFKSMTLYGKKKKTFKQKKQDKGHRSEIETFIASIKNGSHSPISFEDLYLSSLATFKVIEPIRSRQTIHI